MSHIERMKLVARTCMGVADGSRRQRRYNGYGVGDYIRFIEAIRSLNISFISLQLPGLLVDSSVTGYLR